MKVNLRMKTGTGTCKCMKKGYIYIVVFSIFVGVSQSLKYRVFIKRDLEENVFNFIIQSTSLFLLTLIPGLLLVRWYYKQKNKGPY